MFSLTQILTALSAAGSALALPASNPDAAAIAGRTAGASTGDMTYYQPGLGACGWTSTDAEAVVAVSPARFDGSCGRSVTITGPGGKTATARVVDKCPSCAAGAIDVSSTVFASLADLSVGRTTVSWSFE